ncbi:hypothetical protein ACODT5_17070 [Streptomyces sp. 5.8]|uniref:hypothetical protein n=1 Tax=Streptomyces sp. 5.8 TaxID=3406571 RepID=UPI003BB61F8A
MACAFALPSLHSGPHRIPVGVSGPARATDTLRASADANAWDIRVYRTPADVRSAVESRETAGGIALTGQGVDVYTATAGGPSATGAITALGDEIAAQHLTAASAHDLAPPTADDPRGSGLTSALLPMVFGGIFPTLVLGGLFPGHRGLRTRLAGALLFSVVTGAAVAAVLQFATHSIDGTYWLTALGIALGMAAMSTVLLGLQALLGTAGFALGTALMMLLGNPLSGLASGPYWLPTGWAALGTLAACVRVPL